MSHRIASRARRALRPVASLALVSALATALLVAGAAVVAAAGERVPPDMGRGAARPAPTDSGALVPQLAVTSEAPTAYLARDHCLSAQLTADVAWECGDLRVVHPLPAVTVRGRRYAPTLLYNSQHARPFPLVAATLTLPPSLAARVDSVRLTVAMEGQIMRRRTVAADAWRGAGPVTRRVAIGLDAGAWPTGVYAYTVTATIGADTARAAGRLLVVNRARSPFGAGWWLAGYEQLAPLQPLSMVLADSLLWVGGDGSARIYRRRDAWRRVFHADDFTRPDSLVQTDSGFVRMLPQGARVVFDWDGTHRVTRDAAGTAVLFEADSADARGVRRLRQLRVVGPQTERAYSFAYHAGAEAPNARNAPHAPYGATLARVDAPGPEGPDGPPRVVRAVTVRGALRALRDPNGTWVQFAYDRATGALTRRLDRRGVAWSFAYDGAARRLHRARADVADLAAPTFDGTGEPVVHTFGTAAAMGLADWSPEPVSPAAVHAWHDGPRIDVADVTQVWLDRLGQPVTVQAPSGALTRVARDDARFPGLVTRVVGATGLTTTAAYDARGRVVAVTVQDPLGDGRDATTRYAWDAAWDVMTETVSPEGVVTRFGYDPLTGHRRWVEDGRGPAGRVWFFPSGRGLVDSVRTPLARAPQRFAYDALGNVVAEHSPGGVTTRYLRDALGRDTLTRSPIERAGGDVAAGDGAAPTRARRVRYDVADRVVEEEHVGPPLAGAPAETLRVVRAYDEEGRLVALDRVARPDLTRTGSALRTTWVYDALGRPVVERAPDGATDSTRYDPAGNVVRRVTRRGHVVTYAYDAANRLVARALPEVAYPPATIDGWQFPSAPSAEGRAGGAWPARGVAIPADTERFAYDALGRLLRAENRDATIRRRYLPGGWLATDTTIVRVGLGSDTATHTTGVRHAYDLDGRRRTTRVASGAADSALADATVGYAYDSAGAIASVTDPLGRAFHYAYDLEGRVAQLTAPGGLAEHTTFDDDGRLAGRTVVRVRDASGAAIQDTVLAIALEFDARGKVRRAHTSSTSAESLVDASYSGLGALVALREENVPNSEAGLGDGTAALGMVRRPMVREETFETDAFGQTVATWATDASGVRRGTRFGYSLRNPGRLVDRWETMPRTTGRDHNVYDGAGNLVVQQRTTYVAPPDVADASGRDTARDTALDTVAVTGVAVHAYGADERLRVSDRRTAVRSDTTRADAATVTDVLQETRYDGLGRRVLVLTRSRAPASDGPHRPEQVTRTRYLWDGDQVLAEGHDLPTEASSPVAGRARRTLYTHGAGLDDPLSIIDVVPTSAGDSVAVATPRRDWRGLLRLVVDSTGVSPRAGPSGWTASTGERYRRNRYFDPVQRRFTQEDPLGVAGGPSAYGTGGDPVSYADPFGLCRVEVRYARLGAFLGRAFHHAYVVTTAPDLTRLFFRAGPSAAGPGGGSVGQLGAAVLGVVANAFGLSSAVATSASGGGTAAWGAIQTQSGRYEPGAVDWDPASPPATRYVDDSAPCDGYVASFTRTLDAIANRRITYNPFTANSNAVVRELLAKAGLTPGAPIVWAPGWGAALLR